MASRIRGLPRLDQRPAMIKDLVYEALRDAIIQRTLEPGSTVTEAELAANLGVSKTPVREGLLRLIEVGLVEATEEKRYHIIPVTRERITDAFELREHLEKLTARKAALMATEVERQLIRDAAHQSQVSVENRDFIEFQQWDQELHTRIAEATRNRYLIRAAMNVFALTWTMRRTGTPDLGYSTVCADHHVAIAAAIEHADPDEAARLMGEHVRTVRERVLAQL